MAEPNIGPISILVCGMTGAGKSSLVNYILGEDVCGVGDAANFIDAPEEAFRSHTAVVKEHEGIVSIKMNGVMVTVYDSPGLQDGMDNDQKYLDDMYEKCHDVDLVLYCHDITRVRWADSEEKCINLFTEKFGATFWNKAILVLTKANLLQPFQLKDDPKEYLEKMILVNSGKFRSDLKKVLQDKGYQCAVTSNITDSLPVVPAGSERDQNLPTGPFIGNMWITCMERLPIEKTGTFMKATNFIKRVVLNTSESPLPAEKKKTKYLLHIDLLRFKILAKKCMSVFSDIWEEIMSKLSAFIPPGD